ncbi:hypothetical protein CHU92_14350 [Flavobacterium cyanobacteriorum]|uniref:Right handed beta helix domain-containing protein n=1 Tax=Flavobacterium cyanobacteriorum TaxID=2022802 RepID=A0A255YS87_9FLAO|nr:hypothetical protein [Flavobacterium cyanobacteriorum]OYQ32059.1 hypothetical protein CHU92_14350 [Flavobacterium cyanobacteriorum]
MKKTLLLTLFLLFLNNAVNATIRTVSNVPGGVAQFNNLNAAVNASAANDTLLLAPSATPYTLGYNESAKKLYFFGAGFAPVQSPNGTSISTNYVRAASTFEGIWFRNITNIYMESSGISFIRCYFSDILHVNASISNLLISGCFFARPLNGAGQRLTNSIIRNTIFYGTSENCLTNFNNGSSNNILFDQNLFYGTNGSLNAFFSCNNLLFTNNVFLKMNFSNSITNSNFTRNLTFNTAGGTPPVWTTNGNSSNNNLFDASPMYAAMTDINNGATSWSVDYYRLGASSSGKNYSIGGRDVGLLFENGSDNYNFVRNSRLPYISSMLIDSSSLPLGSNLGVTVQAVKAN